MEEETEEEREKMETKRRNYKLVVERAGRKRGQDTVEDQVRGRGVRGGDGGVRRGEFERVEKGML